MLDQLRDDEEVGGVALAVDDVDLVRGAIEIDLRHLTPVEAFLQPLRHLMGEPGGGGVSVGDGGDGHAVMGVRRPQFAVVLHPLRDEQGVVAGPRDGAVPHGAHLRGGLDVVAVAAELEPVLVVKRLAGLHTEHRLVGPGLVLDDVVAVVGHQRRQVEALADLQQFAAHPGLDVDPVIHQLEEIVVPTVDVLPHRRGLESLVELPEAQTGLDVTGRTAGGGDDAGGVLGDEIGVHAGPLAELPLVGRHRRQVEEVAQPGGVLRDHRLVQVCAGGRDVVGFLVGLTPADALLVEPGFGGEIGLDADDRFDAGVGHRVVERVRAEHVAVVGHADRRHLLPGDLLGEQIHLGHAVEHGVFRVVVQVDEGGAAHGRIV